MGRLIRLGAAIALGYGLGMISTADVVAKRMGGRDLRNSGTGNPGAANALKVLGAKAAGMVMLGDITKAVVACAAGGALAGPAGAHLAGTASVAGHCYPANTGFRGGKGVATSVGQCAATFPAYFPIDVGVAAASVSVPAWKQRAFAATVTSCIFWVSFSVLWWRNGWRNLWGPRPTATLPISSLLSSIMIIERFVAAGALSGGPSAEGDTSAEAAA